MSVGVDPCMSATSGTLSWYVTTATAVAAAITFSASGAAPTPLYHEYQEHFGLTAFMITIIFAAYVLWLLLALLTVGSLSDYIGRRPVILAALTLNILAMILIFAATRARAARRPRHVRGSSRRSTSHHGPWAGSTFRSCPQSSARRQARRFPSSAASLWRR
jgi:MFS family permease